MIINTYIRPYKIFRELRKNLYLKTSGLESLQWNKFRMLLNHAYQNVPFYRSLFDKVGVRPYDIENADDIYKIPIITKSQIKNNKVDMIARNINLSACVEYKTSGSTGNMLTGFLTRDDALHVRGSYERVRSDNGFRTLRDTLLIIGSPYLIPKNKGWHQYLGIRRIKRLNVFESLDKQLEILKKAKADVVWGVPSAIRLLAKIIQEREIRGISPRLIFTVSEILNSETRNFINSVFNIEVIDVYGSWETCCLAWECHKHSGYHVNMDTALLEFLDKDGNKVKAGERGRVVVTNLNSFAMPIIRYEIGDFAIPTYKECPCGRGGYLIKGIEGRYNDFIKLSNNKLVTPTAIYSIMEHIVGVSEFQVVQEKEDEFVVYVVKKNGDGDAVIVEEINREFKKVLGDHVYISTKFVEGIGRDGSGKLRSVISMT